MSEKVEASQELSDHYAAYLTIRDEKLQKAKKELIAVCDSLSETPIKLVVISYNGYGDSGSIEECRYYTDVEGGNGDSSELCDDELTEALSKVKEFAVQVYDYEAHGYKSCMKPVGDKLEDLAYDFLPCGWEINEGSFGTLNIKVDEKELSRDHGTRIEDVDWDADTFQLEG